MECEICLGEKWVCENHPNNPWRSGDPGCCGGAGAPCVCSRLHQNNWSEEEKQRRAEIEERYMQTNKVKQ